MSRFVNRGVAAGMETDTSTFLSRLEAFFWPQGFKRDIWMIADGARDPQIVPLIREFHLEHYCLYNGPLTPALASAAPYLVQLDYDDDETRRFLGHAWSRSWGVFLKCGIHPNRLRSHLRELLVVRDTGGTRFVFRYYDPRVLRLFLPTCTKQQLETFFDPIHCFWAETENPDTVFEFTLRHCELIVRDLSLAD